MRPLGVGDVVVDCQPGVRHGLVRPAQARRRSRAGSPSSPTTGQRERGCGARTGRRPTPPSAAGLRIDLAPDGSLVVAGQAARGFLDWYTVAFETTGAVRWEAVRDGGLNTNEIPAEVLVLADGTTVVTGVGGPNLPGGFIQGVTAGYGPDGDAALGGVRENGHRVGRRRSRAATFAPPAATTRSSRAGASRARRQPAAGGRHLRHAHDRRCAADRELRRLWVDRPGRNREVRGPGRSATALSRRERWPRTSTPRRVRTRRR